MKNPIFEKWSENEIFYLLPKISGQNSGTLWYVGDFIIFIFCAQKLFSVASCLAFAIFGRCVDDTSAHQVIRGVVQEYGLYAETIKYS